jgi:hypothetical protein
MIVPMSLVAIWSVLVYEFCKAFFSNNPKQREFLPPTQPIHTDVEVLDKFDPILLTVLGFLVGLALSFRSTTAYERYNEGRKYWAQLTFTTQNLARVIWVHAKEREGELGKEDLLAKVFVSPSHSPKQDQHH